MVTTVCVLQSLRSQPSLLTLQKYGNCCRPFALGSLSSLFVIVIIVVVQHGIHLRIFIDTVAPNVVALSVVVCQRGHVAAGTHPAAFGANHAGKVNLSIWRGQDGAHDDVVVD